MWQRVVDCLGVATSVVSEVADIEGQLAAVFRTYADTERAPQLSYRLLVDEWPTVHRQDGWRKRGDSLIDLVPLLELDLYAQVTACASGLVLHAGAVVGANGQALVFPGVSGAGKSTLMRALLARGFDYMSEECVALSSDGTCIGLARALHIEDERVTLPSDFVTERYVLRTADGYRHTWLAHPPASRVWRAPSSVAAIVCLSHGADADNRLVRLGEGETLVRAWPAVLRQRLDDSNALSCVPCYAMRTTTPERALDNVLGLAKELGVDAS